MSLCGGVERFITKRVAFSYRGSCEYFLGDRVYHQFSGGFRIPSSPPADMTPTWTRDVLMGQLRTNGISAASFVGEPMEYQVYRTWLRGVSIGPIMSPFSSRPGATEIGGKMVEGYFSMTPPMVALEEENRGLRDDNVRLRAWLSKHVASEVIDSEIPPRPHRETPKDPYYDFPA